MRSFRRDGRRMRNLPAGFKLSACSVLGRHAQAGPVSARHADPADISAVEGRDACGRAWARAVHGVRAVTLDERRKNPPDTFLPERRRRDANGRFMDRRRLRRPQRVLLVDDEADVRDVWREWLTLWQFQVDEAENGSVAVAKAREHRPDLVIMDLTMPVLDGFGATRQLKSHPDTAGVPVLLLSADMSPSARGRGLVAGGDVFLSKPIQPRELLEEIRRAFRRIIAEARSSPGGDLPQ